ncbi:MAG: hypothetical protein NT144_07695 [Bacteroidia bacterium]|nr:hypothetical protein [Bacteroidia bacterium]
MKTVTILILFFFCLNINVRKGKFFLSNWHENGNAELNVPSDEYSFFKKGKLYYFLSNDNDNIYIDIKIEDSGIQNRILKQGLTIWVNMDSKLVKKMGIRFPIGSQNSGGRKKPNMPDNNMNLDGSLISPLSLANTVELIGFSNEEARRFPADNADNFRGLVKYDNEGTLHYKMIVPIAKIPVRNSKEGIGAMPFTFGIEYGALPVTNGSQGQGSGNAGAGSNTSQNSIPPVLLWIKNIKLATDK